MERHTSPNREIIGSADGPRAIVDRVSVLIEPLCVAEGLELVAVQFRNEHGGRILRLLIDRPGGVSLDDCVAISRQAGDILDVGLDDAMGAYRLEVSSPGLDRPLVTRADYERFAGRMIRLRTRTAIDGRKNFTGRLEAIADDTVTMQLDDQVATVKLDNIARAQLVPRSPI